VDGFPEPADSLPPVGQDVGVLRVLPSAPVPGKWRRLLGHEHRWETISAKREDRISFAWDQRTFQEMKHDLFSGHFGWTRTRPRWTSSVRWAYAYFLKEWRRRPAQSSGVTPDWKWGRPLRPQRKVSSPARLLELSKETGGGRTHTF